MQISKYKQIIKTYDSCLNPTINIILLAIDISLLFIFLRYLTRGTTSFFFSSLGITVLLFHSFSLFHDATHRILFKSVFVNDFIGIILGSFCLLPYHLWREDHLSHHKWAGNIQRDPVMKLVRDAKDNKFPNKLVSLIWKSWIPVLGMAQYTLFWTNSLENTIRRPSLNSFISLICPLILWCFLLYQFSFYLLFSLILFFMLVEFVNFPHHLGTIYLRENQRLPCKDQDKVSRTCLFPKWFSWMVILNFNYHAEHHQFPLIPWYRLPDVARNVANDREFTCNNFDWIIRNRKKDILNLVSEHTS